MTTNEPLKPISVNEISPPAAKRNVLKQSIVVLIVIGVVAWGITTRLHDGKELIKITEQRAIPTVSIVQPVQNTQAQILTLPATLEAFNAATVYARVSGYLKSWAVDIGTPVKAGQLLAEIETPELDQQLNQAQANLDTALANERLTALTNKRWQNLLKSDSVSQQEADEKNGDYEAKKAIVKAATAELNRLRALSSFKHITAPFSGIVTSRKTDIGALINAGHDAGHELFTIADMHKLRLYVQVPQSYANLITPKLTGQLELQGIAGKTFMATLTANSKAIDENSGSMLIEFEVDNADGKLLAGSFGNLHLSLQGEVSAMGLEIPASTLMFRKEGLSVATVTADNHVAFKTITISHDKGKTVEVGTGLNSSDKLINNPADSLENGDVVQIAGGK